MKGGSVKSVWERCCISRPLDTGYRIYKRLCLCQSILRTRLSCRAPPPKANAGVPLFQMFNHLKKAFGDLDPIRQYQEHFQRNFLSTT